MPRLIGLPGLTGAVDAELFRSVSGGIRGLRRARARTAAGDYGAINLWVDDDASVKSLIGARKTNWEP